MGRWGRRRGRGYYHDYDSFYPHYVPVAERRAKATREMDKLRKKGKNVQPVVIEGRALARSFWGKAWCDHLESFSDYSNRLPRGRSYARNGSVCHLEIAPGRIEALVSGSSLYKIAIEIAKLKDATWKTIKGKCTGRIASILELLQGKLSDQVMTIVTDRKQGLFPLPGEIKFSCNCPDVAGMCKHLAAVFYGIGNRLDSQPELLFLLRGVDAEELISADLALPTPEADAVGDALAADALSGIFGIELDTAAPVVAAQTHAAPQQEAPSAPQQDAAPAPRQQASPTPQPLASSTPPSSRKRRQSSDRPKAGRRPKATPKTKAPAKTQTNAPAKRQTKTQAKAQKPTGESIAQLRRQLGLTVAQMAECLGVTPASIYRWEAAAGPLKLQSRPLRALEALQREAAAIAA